MAKRCKFVRVTFSGPILNPIMSRIGCLGITMPWRTAYIRAHDDPRVIRHELVHLAQIRRDGDLRFWCRYFYFTWRYGYSRNPYEAEADRIAGTADYRT